MNEILIPGGDAKENIMFDLLYGLDEQDLNLIRITFPTAIIEDASDAVHERRFSIKLPEAVRDDYMVFLLKEDLAVISLDMQLMSKSKDKHPKLRELIARAKKELGIGEETQVPS